MPDPKLDLSRSDWRSVPCKLWTGSKQTRGYGQRSIRIAPGKWRRKGVHRITWEEAHGAIPEGMFVCHRCDNPSCYELTHLFLGTAADNNADMVAKGRNRYACRRGEKVNTAKLTVGNVLEMRALYARGNISQSELGRLFGVSNQTARRVVLNLRWKHV